MKSKVFIRVDGNVKIGLGHIYRCISLASMLKSDFDVCFFLCNSDSFVNELIKNCFFPIVVIEKDDEFINYLNECEIVILDGYNFDINYQNKIRLTGVKCVCIDDIQSTNFVADLIINYAPYAVPADYEGKIESHTRLALGVEFILLRQSFFQISYDKIKETETKILFICFGGSDINNLTNDTLRVALKFQEFKKILVVTGASYRNSTVLRKLCETDNRVEYYHSIDENSMVSLMCQSDLAIVPASSILYEILCCGVTPLITVCAENQKKFHDFLVKKYNINSFGDSEVSINDTRLTKEIAGLIKKKSTRNPKIFYEKIHSAPTNILNLFHSLFGSKRFSFENGKIEFVNFTELSNEEHEMVLSWRNDERIRKWMKTDTRIQKTDHLMFVNNLNESNTDIYWLVYRKNVPCGVVYLNRINAELRTAEWGLYMGVNFIGTGLGLELSFYALKVFFNCLGIEEVFGTIKSNNFENLKLQKIIGFDFHHSVNIANKEYMVTSINRDIYNKIPVNFSNYQKEVLWKKK